MPEIFLGDLSQEKLFDILKPLLIGKENGRVAFKGNENGEICLEMGNVVHAKTDHSSGEHAFFEIMGWRTGKITFELNSSIKERTILTPTEQLLLNWSYRKQEWEKIKEVVPSPHAIFCISLQKNPKDRNINADQWNVLALSNGKKTVAEVAQTLNWDEFKTSKTVCQLVQAGLLEKTEGSRPVEKKLAGESFFQTLENEFKKKMGPVASFIINDKLNEYGETRDSLSKDQALPFVEALSEEIPDDLKRKDFLKVIAKFLSSIK